MSKKSQLISFEEQIKRLEHIVQTLDQGNASLDEMLAFYEEGMALTASCRKVLDEAEQKLTILEKKNV